jgi:hypothetical protein
MFEPYDNPFWEFSYGFDKKERRKIVAYLSCPSGDTDQK